MAYIYLTGIDLRLRGCMHDAHVQYNPYTRFNPRWFRIDKTSVKSDPRIYSKSRDHRLTSFLCPYPSYLYISKESFPWLVVLSPAVYTITYKCRFGLWNVWSFDFGGDFFSICMAWYSTNISTDQLNHRDFCGFKGRVKNRTPF